jgi:hypothetical protein
MHSARLLTKSWHILNMPSGISTRYRNRITGNAEVQFRMLCARAKRGDDNFSLEGSLEERAPDFAPTLALVIVSLLWATYGPCVRLIYQASGAYPAADHGCPNSNSLRR